MLTKRDVILVKVESTYNTDSTPSGTDAVLVENPSWAYEGLRMNDRPAVRTSMGMMQKIYGGSLKAVSFDVELKGSGTAGTAPEFDALLEAAGMVGTNVVSTSETYALTSNPATHAAKSVTIYYYQDGTRHIITGGMVSALSFTLEVGAPGKMSMTVVGHHSTQTDTALATPTYDSTVPAPFINGTFAAHSYASVISSLSLDLGIQMSMEPDVNGSDGYGTMTLTGRDPNGSFDPASTLVATHDFLGKFESGATGTIVTGTIGGTAGNQWALTLNDTYYTNITPADRGGVRIYTVPFSVTDEGTTDNELSLAFT